MNGPDHFREAERLADAYKSAVSDVEALPRDTERQRLDRLYVNSNAHALLTKAQVHATLALTAAQVEAAYAVATRGADDGIRPDWIEAIA